MSATCKPATLFIYCLPPAQLDLALARQRRPQGSQLQREGYLGFHEPGRLLSGCRDACGQQNAKALFAKKRSAIDLHLKIRHITVTSNKALKIKNRT